MSTVTDSLRTGGQRARTHDAQMVTKLPKAAKALVRTVGQDQGMTDGAVVRDALAEYFERRGYLA